MGRYRFAFSEEAYGYIYFDAKDKEDAESYFNALDRYDIDETELPNFAKSIKGGQGEYIYQLEEVS